MSIEERLGRLDYRNKEAEKALKQLETCIEIIQQKSKDGVISNKTETIKELERENVKLREEAQKLNEKLTQLEFLNGIEQIPLPNSDNQHCKVSQPPQIQSDEASGTGPLPTAKTKGKNEEKKKKEKVKKENNGATGGDRPVDVSRFDLRVGQIISVKKHPDADTLYVEEIELGEERPRTVCSGLVQNIPIDQMENRMVLLLCNLKHAKMRGVVSEAMVMCACTRQKTEILDPPEGAVPGDKIIVEGFIGTPDDVLNPKKKIFEQVQPDLLTDGNGVACYKGIPLEIPGKGVFKSQTLLNSIIK